MSSPRAVGDRSMLSGAELDGWVRPDWRTAYWLLSAFGVVVLVAAWAWFGLAFEEEMTEQPKSLAAGSTEAGFGAVVGGVPLVILHGVGLAVLSVVAILGRRSWTGILYALFAVALASGAGILVGQILWNGRLFQMGADAVIGG